MWQPTESLLPARHIAGEVGKRAGKARKESAMEKKAQNTEPKVPEVVNDAPVPGQKLKEPPKPLKVKYRVNRKGFLMKTAMVLAGLSIIFRFIGYWGIWNTDMDAFYLKLLLPAACAALFLLTLFAGSKALWLTSIPVFLEAVFLIIETFSIQIWWIKVLGILLYVVAVCVYAMTGFGKIRTNWLLVVVIGVPLVYHLAVQDRSSLVYASSPDTLIGWMPEISAVCFLISLLFVALSMEKVPPKGVYDPRAELEQIRGLKYVPAEMEYRRRKKAEPPAANSTAEEEYEPPEEAEQEPKSPAEKRPAAEPKPAREESKPLQNGEANASAAGAKEKRPSVPTEKPV